MDQIEIFFPWKMDQKLIYKCVKWTLSGKHWLIKCYLQTLQNGSKINDLVSNVKYRFISGFTTRVQPQDHSATEQSEFSLRFGSVSSISVNPIFLGAKSQIKKRSN